jgi:hypothetical protein
VAQQSDTGALAGCGAQTRQSATPRTCEMSPNVSARCGLRTAKTFGVSSASPSIGTK